MLVTGNQFQPVSVGGSGNPDVVFGDGLAFELEVLADLGVLLRRAVSSLSRR